MRRWTLVVAVLLAVALSGCGSDEPGAVPSPRTSSSTPSPTTGAGQFSGHPIGTPTTDGGRTSAPTAPTYDASATGAAFASPTGNIVCMLAGDPQMNRCDITERTYKAPARPADCPLSYGSSFALDGVASIGCVGDTVLGQAAPGTDYTSWFTGPGVTSPVTGQPIAILAYGESIKVGAVVCGSAKNGVTCTDVDSGHGFRVSRASYEIF